MPILKRIGSNPTRIKLSTADKQWADIRPWADTRTLLVVRQVGELRLTRDVTHQMPAIWYKDTVIAHPGLRTAEADFARIAKRPVKDFDAMLAAKEKAAEELRELLAANGGSLYAKPKPKPTIKLRKRNADTAETTKAAGQPTGPRRTIRKFARVPRDR